MQKVVENIVRIQKEQGEKLNEHEKKINDLQEENKLKSTENAELKATVCIITMSDLGIEYACMNSC